MTDVKLDCGHVTFLTILSLAIPHGPDPVVTLKSDNLVNNNVFGTKPVPIDSPHRELSIQTGFVSN